MKDAKIIRRKYIYSSGDKYGFLMLTGKCYLRNGLRYVEAICGCGKTWFTCFRDVLSGRTKSCGCKKVELIKNGTVIHGMCLNGQRHPIYRAWFNMKSRCNGTREEDFNNYTLRGIVVCGEWNDNFKSFYEWSISNGWRKGLSLDRFPNNDGNYEPTNCRWGTDAMQTRNTRQNVFIEAFGEKKCLQDWAHDKRCSVARNTIKHRINILKWDFETAITHPNKNLKENRKGDRRNSRLIKYNNTTKSLFEWCNQFGLKYKLIWGRIFTKGWSVKRAFETSHKDQKL